MFPLSVVSAFTWLSIAKIAPAISAEDNKNDFSTKFSHLVYLPFIRPYIFILRLR